ncbi:MAG: NUDIX domain-containing protein [Candidatus Saccharibacteria bacterium]
MDVVYVDKDDKVIGSGSITYAVDNSIRVRIARIFLSNSKGEILIQKRSATHKSLPNRWDQTSAGHVDAGEDYDEAAYRELKEEMGIDGVKLTRVKTYYAEEADESQIKKRFNTLYVGSYDGPVKIDPEEVSDYKWLTLDELDKQMTNNPDNFTQGAVESFREYQKYLSSAID